MTSLALPLEQLEAAARPVAGPVLATDQALLFVVPVFNEEDNLDRLIGDLERRPWLFSHPDCRVALVDDGSTDSTPAILARYRGPLPLDVVTLPCNQGPGAAFRAGFAAVLADAPEDALVVTIEADTTSDLDALPALLAHARDGTDLVLASVHAGGRMVRVTPLRRVLSRGAGWVVRRRLGVDVHTVSSFFRVYRATALRRAVSRYGGRLIEEQGFACMAEVLGKMASLGASVVEVPVDLDGGRRIGPSKMALVPTLVGYGRLLVRGTAHASRAAP